MGTVNNIGECISVFIPQNKSKEFWEIITDSGFSKDSKGVLEYILADEGETEEEESEIPTVGSVANEAIRKWKDANPEKWNKAKEKGSAFVQGLLNKIGNKL